MNNHNPTLDMLRAIPTLGGASDSELAPLVPMVDAGTIRAGAVLVREGAAARQAFVIVDGTADVTQQGRHLRTVGAGEIIGEIGMLDHAPRTATVRARTDLTVLVIGAATFATFVDHPLVARAIGIQLARATRDARNEEVA